MATSILDILLRVKESGQGAFDDLAAKTAAAEAEADALNTTQRAQADAMRDSADADEDLKQSLGDVGLSMDDLRGQVSSITQQLNALPQMKDDTEAYGQAVSHVAQDFENLRTNLSSVRQVESDLSAEEREQIGSWRMDLNDLANDIAGADRAMTDFDRVTKIAGRDAVDAGEDIASITEGGGGGGGGLIKSLESASSSWDGVAKAIAGATVPIPYFGEQSIYLVASLVPLVAILGAATVALGGFAVGAAAAGATIALGVGGIFAGAAAVTALAFATGHAQQAVDGLGTKAKAMADALGKQAAPAAIQFAQWATRMLPAIKTVGSTIVTDINNNLKGMIPIMTRFTQDSVNAFNKLANNVSVFFNQIGSRKNELSNLFVGFTQVANTAVQGVLANLLKLTDWFNSELPTLGPVVKQIMSGAGTAIQGFGSAAAKVVNGVVADWPQIMSVWHQLGASAKSLNLGSAAGAIGTFFSHLSSMDPAIRGVASAIRTLEGIAKDLQGPLSAVGSVLGGLAKNSGAVRDFVLGLVALKGSAMVFSAISKSIVGIAGGIKTIKELGSALKEIGSTVSAIAGKLGEFGGKIAEVAGKVAGAVGNLAQLSASLIKQAALWVANTAKMVANAAATVAVKAAQLAAAAASKIWAAAQAALDAVMDANPIALLIIGIAALIAIIILVVTHWKQTQAVLTEVWGVMQSVAAWIAGAFVAAWDAVISAIDRFIATARQDISDFVSAIRSGFDSALNAAAQWISSMVSRIGTGISNVVSTIKSGFAALPGEMVSIGSQIISGLISGIESMASSVASAAASVVKGAVSAAKSALGISSPSRVMAQEVGIPAMQGLAQGILGGLGTARSAMGSAVRSVVGAATGASAGLSLQTASGPAWAQQLHNDLQQIRQAMVTGNANTAATAANTNGLTGKKRIGGLSAQQRSTGPAFGGRIGGTA